MLVLVAALVTGVISSSAVAQRAGSEAQRARTVVELFTSQGCSSCAPADAFLGELAKREDLIALSFHVDYWNYLGWRDPFSSPESTARQRAYGRSLGKRYVYTPQMVIGGVAQAVGSGRSEVLALIDKARLRNPLDIRITHPDADTATLHIGAGSKQRRPAAVWFAFYDDEHVTKIARGENRGRRLVNTNVVRSMKQVGVWRGDELEINLSLSILGAKGRDGCAVIVQEADSGPILGAVTFALPRQGS
jgi:hypothetical protein